MTTTDRPPVPPESVGLWCRTYRRAPGSPWRIEDRHLERRHEGPWHAMFDQSQSWCGRHPRVVFGHEHRWSVPGGRLCPDCLRALGQGRAWAFRGRGSRAASSRRRGR